jgi:hypothetical protein
MNNVSIYLSCVGDVFTSRPYIGVILLSKFFVGFHGDKIYNILFVETPRRFITAKLSIRKPGSSSVLII